jgi:hypothetical protein
MAYSRAMVYPAQDLETRFLAKKMRLFTLQRSPKATALPFKWGKTWFLPEK